MTIDIRALIEQRPHLKDPLELYGKWQGFHHQAAELLPKLRTEVTAADSRAYPRDIAGQVCQMFLAALNLPAEKYQPLCQALEAGDIDFMRLPFGEVPALPSLDSSEEELAGILFLLGRPYFLALRESFPQAAGEWQGGRCPLCSAPPALSSIVEGPKRILHCSFCGTTGTYRFIGCPNCGTVDTAKLNTIVSEDEPGFRISTCDGCHTYVKIVEGPILTGMAIDLADLASLPLDFIAQGKGYARMAPNPISLQKIG